MAQISRIYFIQKDRKKPTRDTLFQRHTFTYMYTYMVSVGPQELQQFGGGLKVFLLSIEMELYCPTSNANTFIGCPNMLGQEKLQRFLLWDTHAVCRKRNQ